MRLQCKWCLNDASSLNRGSGVLLQYVALDGDCESRLRMKKWVPQCDRQDMSLHYESSLSTHVVGGRNTARLPLIARYMGPIWGRQDPGGSRVGPLNLAIWDPFLDQNAFASQFESTLHTFISVSIIPWPQNQSSSCPFLSERTTCTLDTNRERYKQH